MAGSIPGCRIARGAPMTGGVPSRFDMPMPGPPALIAFPPIARQLLDNGLAIWSVEHSAVPLVTSRAERVPVLVSAPPPVRGIQIGYVVRVEIEPVPT